FRSSLLRDETKGGQVAAARMKGHRVWKITKAIGVGAGVLEIHPHAFRHSSGVELLRLTRGLQSLFEPVFQSRPGFRHLIRHGGEHLPLKNPTRLKHAACTTPMI